VVQEVQEQHQPLTQPQQQELVEGVEVDIALKEQVELEEVVLEEETLHQLMVLLGQ
tara:strand:+ start:417 stop:584 length:168 start_codon:yes stop_codon:yes gene_type:complete